MKRLRGIFNSINGCGQNISYQVALEVRADLQSSLAGKVTASTWNNVALRVTQK